MTGYTIPTKEKIKAVLSSCSRSADFTASAEHFYDLGVRYDIDPAFVVAVAALESGWGSSPIASDCKNVFNINYVSGGAYSSCTGHSRYVQYLSYQQGIDVFCDSLIMETYVKKHNQKTPAQITCATWSGVTDHCYCCDVISERDAWADQVAAIRAKFQQ
jgi:beta-N-acetylglucosaminidase